MRNVFVATSLADATLVANLLGEHGIGSQTVEKLRGNIGTPYTEVWVTDDTDGEKAARLIAAMNVEREDGEPWACAQCGEENPSSFAICWSCRAESNSAAGSG